MTISRNPTADYDEFSFTPGGMVLPTSRCLSMISPSGRSRRCPFVRASCATGRPSRRSPKVSCITGQTERS